MCYLVKHSRFNALCNPWEFVLVELRLVDLSNIVQQCRWNGEWSRL